LNEYIPFLSKKTEFYPIARLRNMERKMITRRVLIVFLFIFGCIGVYAQTNIVPDGEKARMASSSDRIVQSEISCTDYYFPGNTHNFTFNYIHSSPDSEWTDGIMIQFPQGMTVNSATNITGANGILNWNNETGYAALVTWGDTIGGSGYGPINSNVSFTVNVTMDSNVTGDLYLNWTIIGDQYGAPPHSNSGTIAISEGFDNDLSVTTIKTNYIESFAHQGIPLTPRVTYTNQGLETQNSFIIGLTDGRNYNEEIVVNQNIAYGENQTIYFPCWTPDSAGNITLKAYVNLLDDENIQNDTAYQTFNVFGFRILLDPPALPRSIAEFETNRGVIVRANNSGNFNVPYLLLFLIAQESTLYIICSSQSIADIITNNLINFGVNINHVEFILIPSNTQWTRDYGPWFIEYGNHSVGITNFGYDRNRPHDNAATVAIADYFDVESFDMPLVHTGGNYMTDGFGTTASCDLLYYENNCLSESQVHDSLRVYLGLTDYHILPDPLHSGLQHIDCWGKFLAPDKIIILQVPNTNPNYQALEDMAIYWSNQTTPYGNKYKVYRVFTPNGQPYANSLILNNKVLVPMNPNFGNDCYLNALNSYQVAMPGYEIVGVPYDAWWGMDALHCRTNQVPDHEMLRIVHYPYLDTISYRETYHFEAEIYSLSATQSMGETAKLYYKVNNEEYQQAEMTNAGNDDLFSVNISGLNPGDSVCYYIQAQNNNNKLEKHPYIGEYDPHRFYVGPTSSINEEIAPAITLYPNPATNGIYIAVNQLNAGQYRLQLFNVQGSKVFEKEVDVYKNSNHYYIDISALQPGCYILNITGDNGSVSKQFIKQN